MSFDSTANEPKLGLSRACCFRPIFLAGSPPGFPQGQRLAESLELLEKPHLLLWKKTILSRFEVAAQLACSKPSINAGASRQFLSLQHRLAQILGTNSRNIVCCYAHQNQCSIQNAIELSHASFPRTSLAGHCGDALWMFRNRALDYYLALQCRWECWWKSGVMAVASSTEKCEIALRRRAVNIESA